MDVSHSLSSPWPWFNNQSQGSRDHRWLITCAALYTGLGGPKTNTTAETMVKSEVVSFRKTPSISWWSWDAYWSSLVLGEQKKCVALLFFVNLFLFSLLYSGTFRNFQELSSRKAQSLEHCGQDWKILSSISSHAKQRLWEGASHIIPKAPTSSTSPRLIGGLLKKKKNAFSRIDCALKCAWYH